MNDGDGAVVLRVSEGECPDCVAVEKESGAVLYCPHGAPAQGEQGVDASTPQQASGDAFLRFALENAREALRTNDERLLIYHNELRAILGAITTARAAGVREGRRLGLVQAEMIAFKHHRADKVFSDIRAAIAELAAEPDVAASGEE